MTSVSATCGARVNLSLPQVNASAIASVEREAGARREAEAAAAAALEAAEKATAAAAELQMASESAAAASSVKLAETEVGSVSASSVRVFSKTLNGEYFKEGRNSPADRVTDIGVGCG